MMDRLRHTEQTHGGPEEGRRGVLGEQMQVLHIEGRSTKALLCSAGRHSQRLVMDHNGQSMEEDCTHVYVKLDPCAAQQKLTQRCKSTVLQSSFKKKMGCYERMGERKVSIKWMPGNAAPQTLSNLPHVGHTGMMRKTSQGRARVGNRR